MRLAAYSMAWCLMLASCGDDAEPAAGAAPPAPSPPTTGGEAESERGSGGTCGGIAGFSCPDGQWCDLEGNYPDASGACRPGGACDEPTDCTQQDLVHAMCVGDWQCLDGTCAWQCQNG